MKKSLFFALIAAVALWFVSATLLLGIYNPSWLPNAFSTLTKPGSLADFGQAFSAFEGFISSFALMLGLIAIAMQVRQTTDSNVIGAMSARQQFLLAEYARLDEQIATYVEKNTGPGYDRNLVANMVAKRKSLLEESQKIDQRVKILIEKM